MISNNKIAIVTGASTGLGKSISLQLSLKGYEVILASRNKEKLKIVQNEISKDGGNSKIIVTDVSNENDVKKLYSKIDVKRVDVVINNAGFGVFNKIQKMNSKEWDSQINTNLRGAFLMTHYISKSMIDRKEGKLVFINSVAGLKAYPYSSAYVASKFGLRGFTSSLREELREYNIKVISVHPGAIDTPFWNNVNVDFSKDEMMSSDDVAKSVVHAILAPNNIVQEEVVIRRTAGDF
tara:strand:- start:852 stop:1562 length:711 start_codon:yes stop_codon:yes gene_type:complete